MDNLLSKGHEHVFKLQRVRHFGPFNPDAGRVRVLRLVVEPTGQSDGAATMCHHFPRSCLHNHGAGVVLCGGGGRDDRMIYLECF